MLQKYLGLSNYHFRVLLIYVLIIPFCFVFFPGLLRYGFAAGDFKLMAAAVIFIVPGFYLLNLLFNFVKIQGKNLNFSSLLSAAIYAGLFAFPEEIIFRGIVQSFLQDYFANAVFAVILSAFIFGLAHLLNGAGGIYPKNWNWKVAGIAFIAGLPLSWTFALTNSLLVPTLLHALFVFLSRLFIKKSS